MFKRTLLVSALLFALILQLACGGTFATQLRTILAASGPLIESLNLGANKAATIADFTELGGGAATLADQLNSCKIATCKLDAVLQFEGLFETVDARGHLGAHPKLAVVEGILKGIISSAKIYYGGGSPALMSGPPVTEQSIKAQVEALKVAMKG